MTSDEELNISTSQSEPEKSSKPTRLEQELINLGSRKYRLQNEAIKALAKIKDPRAKEKLIEIADSKNWETHLRVSAIEALGKGQRNTQLMNLLIKISNDSTLDREIRRACITSLARFKDIKTLDVFKKALDDDYRFIRFWAIRGLIKLRNPKAIPVLVKGLGDPDEEIRKDVRAHIEMLGKDAVPALLQAFKESDGSKFLKYGVMGLLGRMDHPDVLPALIEALNDENDRVVTIALRGISRQMKPKAINPLVDLYKKSKDKRRLIEDALCRIGQEHPRLFLNKLISIIKEENEENKEKEEIFLMISGLFEKLPDCLSYLEDILRNSEIEEELKTNLKKILEKVQS